MTRRQRKRLIIWSAVSAFVLLAGLAVVIIYWLILGEMPFNQPIADLVVARVMNNSLPSDPAGIVKLPAGLDSASRDGQVYITRDPAGGRSILFITWRGHGANFRGYLYRSAPAPGTTSTPLEINGPTNYTPGAHLCACKSDHQLNPSWCHVYSDLD